MHFNHRLIKTRDFRNPSILTKLIEYLELDEYGSNFPVSVFDPKGFPEEAFYDQLAMVQQARFAQHAAGHVPPQFVSSGYHHEITSTTSTSNTAAAPAVGKPQTSIAAAIELAKLKAQQFSRTLAEQHSSSSSITSTSKKSNPTVSRWDDPLKAMQDLPASPSTSTSKRKREK